MGYQPPAGSIFKTDPRFVVLHNIFEIDAWDATLISQNDLEFARSVHSFSEVWDCITPKQHAVLVSIFEKYKDKI